MTSPLEIPSYAGPESRFDAWENVSQLVTDTVGQDISQATHTVTCGCKCSQTDPTPCGC